MNSVRTLQPWQVFHEASYEKVPSGKTLESLPQQSWMLHSQDVLRRCFFFEHLQNRWTTVRHCFVKFPKLWSFLARIDRPPASLRLRTFLVIIVVGNHKQHTTQQHWKNNEHITKPATKTALNHQLQQVSLSVWVLAVWWITQGIALLPPEPSRDGHVEMRFSVPNMGELHLESQLL